MAKRRVLVCDAMDVAALGLTDAFEIDYEPKISNEDLLSKVENYDALVIRSRTKVDAAVIARGTRLKLVARSGSGVDNIDLRAANARGVEVVSSPEALVEAVAEHVIGLMLALARSIPAADALMKAGQWEKERFVGIELKGKTLGIAGLGRIGRRVAEVARVIGMTLLGYDVIEVPQETLVSLGCRMVDLDTLFASSDFITLHVPLTSETRRMVDQRRISLMKKGSYIINTSRGEVIDEAALAKALRAEEIGGAALDVFENEPAVGAIIAAPNLISTPHIGGQTKDSQTMAVSIVGAKINQFFARRQ
ncbi:MAG TPA: hydroxyacid dehydrogenase [Nitrososphaerales archaeon]|nr:hydroxyacid dehydrogenase [Nitrososphaerales archaeon]